MGMSLTLACGTLEWKDVSLSYDRLYAKFELHASYINTFWIIDVHVY